MTSLHIQVWRDERRYLMKNLLIDETLLAALLSDNIITEDDRDNIMNKFQTRVDRVSCFIDLMTSRGPRGIEAFISALQECKQEWIADKMREALAKATATFSEGPQSGYTDEMYRAILKENLLYFVENLKADARLIAQLLSTDTLLHEEWGTIKAEKGSERVITLCQILQEKHAVGYGGLLTAVEATGQRKVYKQLQEFETEAWSKQVTDVQCKRVLLREERFLMKDLVMTSVFLGSLVMNSVITSKERDRLKKSQFPEKQKVMMLCGMVADKGRAAFGGFLAALSASGQEDMKSHMVRALAECESSPDSQEAAGATAGVGGAAGGEVSGSVEEAADDLAAELARLCVRGSAVNSADGWGWTGLHLAAEDGRTDDARTLIRAGANLDARDVYGTTPLHYACQNGHTSVVHALVAGGADTQIRNSWGNTPRDEAQYFGHAAILELLPP